MNNGGYRDVNDRRELTLPQIGVSSTEVFPRFGVAAQPAIALVVPDGEAARIFGTADDELLDRILSNTVS